MTTEKIIDRVRKLLELANSTNEHEAATAAARAAELMIEHEISEAQIAAANEVEGSTTVKPVRDVEIARDGRTVEWHRVLVSGLAFAFNCRHYYYRAQHGNVDARYHVVGTEDSINAIRMMYAILVREVDQLARRAYMEEVAECEDSGIEAPSARAWKSAFRTGCARTIAQRLHAQRAASMQRAKDDAQRATSMQRAADDASKSQALAVINRQREAVDAFVTERVGRLRVGAGSSAGRSSRSGYSAGAHAGRSVHLGGGARLGKGKSQLKN